MKFPALAAFAVFLSPMFSSVLGSNETIAFDGLRAGLAPEGWTAKMTHAGVPPRWEIRRDDSAPSKPNVLAQVSSGAEGDRWPLLILNKASFQDGEVSVKFKPMAGKLEQAGGVIWRYQNENNYYLARANALENNITVYRVQDGKRTAVGPAVNHRIPAGVWSILKVAFRGPRFEVYFDRRRLLQGQDGAFGGRGKVGLWTQGDSVTYFDDFHLYQR